MSLRPLALVLLACALPARADLIAPGSEGEFKATPDGPVNALYVPRNWKAGAKHPLVLYMAGTGFGPMTWPFSQMDGGNTYLVLGLAYGGQDDLGEGGLKGDPATCSAMIKYFNQVRAAVDKDYGVDASQVFLAGFSKGGWGVNFYGFKPEARGLYCGFCIISAGITTRSHVDLSVAKGLPLLMVNGELDENKKAADVGKPAAEKAGILVEQKVIPGEGHMPPLEKLVDAIEPWLKANGPDKAAAALAKRTAEAATALAAAEKLVTDGKFAAARTALERVVAKWPGTEPAKAASARIAELDADPKVKGALAEEKAKAQLGRAKNYVSNGSWDKAQPMLEQIVSDFPGTKSAEEAKALLASHR